MQEIKKSLKNEVKELKKSMGFTQNDLEERVNNVEEKMCKVKEDLKEIYEYQIDPDNIRIDGIADEPGETWEEYKRRVQRSLSEEFDINNLVIERAHRAKSYSLEKKNSKKLRPRTVVCKLLNFVDKARILKNSYCLKRTSNYVSKDFSKETLAYWKKLW